MSGGILAFCLGTRVLTILPRPSVGLCLAQSTAEPLPELPSWAMMLVLFVCIGPVGSKRAAKVRFPSELNNN
jgi:hypothetical protein